MWINYFFNDDGTIKTVVQTKEGVPAVGPAPAPSPGTEKYAAANASVSGGAILANDDAATGGKCVQNLHPTGSSLQFNDVNGGASGGRATITIHYAAEDNAKLRLSVNDVDYSFVNTRSTGAWDNYTGQSYLTVPLKPGKANVIRLTGGNGGVNVDYITVNPLP